MPVETLTETEDLSSLRRMLSRRRSTAARVQLSVSGYVALLRRLPADHPIFVDVRDLASLVQAGDEVQAG